MDEQMAAGAVFMCRLCNIFSPSHSELLAHCSQVHLQQGAPDDIIVALQPLAAQPSEKLSESPSKRKRGRPKGSTNKKHKADYVSYTEDSVEIDGERKNKEQDENNEETVGLACKECHRTFSNKRQILKHICLKEMEEEEQENNDKVSSGTPKTKKRRGLLFENQISQSKEKDLYTASKKSVVKVFLTEDDTFPDVSKLVPVEENSTETGESELAQAISQGHLQDTEGEAADPSDTSKTDQRPSLKPLTEARKGFQEYSIQQDATSSLQSHLKIFTCEFCNKIFKFRHSLIAHLRTHTQEKPFKCPHCDYASAIKANLNVHLRKHTGDKFHCENCSFTCISSGHLKVHIERVHLKVKHHCSFCKSKYSDVKNLLKHIEKRHNLKDATVNKIYQELRLKTRQGFRQLLFHCPTCKRRFKSRHERERHLLVHGPQRPFGCMLCEYAATKLSSLTTHVRKHFFLYVCCVCKGMFASCHKLKNHLTEFHPELDQDEVFNNCISNSFQLIQPGGVIWGHGSEKQIDQTNRKEDMKKDVIGHDELQKSATCEEEKVEKNLEMVLEQEISLETKASSQNSQKGLCQASENKMIISDNLSEDGENSNNGVGNTKEQEMRTLEDLSSGIGKTDLSKVSEQKQKNTIIESAKATNTDLANKILNVTSHAPSLLLVDDDKTPQSKKESEDTCENSFFQALSLIQKTQLSVETLQQLRKVYGELECQYCGKLFAYKVHYNIHVRTHTKEHLVYCAQCNYSSVTKSCLNRHMIQKHSDLLLSCPNADCKYTTPDKYKLQAHVRRHHEEPKSVSCPVCNNNYPEHRLKQHMRKIHPDTVQGDGKGRMEKQADKCPYCDTYFLKTSNDFQQHIWAHEGLKPFTCNMCDYAGCRKSNLKLHMNRHKTEKSHLCDLCGKKFKSKVTLKSHTLSHTNEGKRFKCSQCDFASALKPSLIRHMEQHARACQPFQCALCYYSCNNVGPLKRHYKKKHPDQKYPDAEAEDSNADAQEQNGALKCPVCESTYGTKSELNHHLKNNHRLNVLEISFEESEAVETQYVPVEDELQLTEVPVETLQDSEAVNILQQITELNSETQNVTPMVAMAPGTVTVMEQIADEQEIGSDQLMVVNADEDLAAEQVMVVEEADGLEALTVLTQGDSTHHYIVYVQEQTVEIN